MERVGKNIFFDQFHYFCSAFSVPIIWAGQPEGMVKYTPDFRFKDGIYLNFEQVKIIVRFQRQSCLHLLIIMTGSFSRRIMEMDKIYFYDDMGVRQEVAKSDIWGYSRNGVLYVQVQENFNRITFVGNICHFVADITTYDNHYYNNSPYGYYDPYYSPYYGYGNYYSPYYSPVLLFTLWSVKYATYGTETVYN